MENCAETKRRVNELTAEVSKLRKIAEEQQSLVECSVCRRLPREVPVPSCPRGHFVCSPCLKYWQRRQECHVERNNCPTCRRPMGTGRSLLAATVIKHALHSCKNEDCTAKVPLEQIKEHEEELCEFRQVLCPGHACPQLIPFNLVSDHVEKCPLCHWPPIKTTLGFSSNITSSFTNSGNFANKSGKTMTLEHNDNQLLFLKGYWEENTYYFDIVIKGNKQDSQKLMVSVSVNDPKTGKSIYKASFHPR